MTVDEGWIPRPLYQESCPGCGGPVFSVYDEALVRLLGVTRITSHCNPCPQADWNAQ